MDNEVVGIKSYLVAVSTMLVRYSKEKIVLEHGQVYIAPEVARPKGVRKGRNRACFMNAYHLAYGHDWQYVEGFAISHVLPIPVEHAWVFDGEVVIETTWQGPGIEYFGIPFEMDFIHKVLLDTGTYGVLDFSSRSFRDRFGVI